MDGGAWQAIVYEVAKSQTGLSDLAAAYELCEIKHSEVETCNDLIIFFSGLGSVRISTINDQILPLKKFLSLFTNS